MSVELPETPPVIRRAVRLWAASAAMCALAAAASLIASKLLGLPRTGAFRLIPIGLGLAPIVFLLPLWHWRVRRFRRSLLEAGFRLCTYCGYDLSTLPPTGRCPECGHTYDAARDVEMWSRQGAPCSEPRPHGFTPWRPPDSTDALARQDADNH